MKQNRLGKVENILSQRKILKWLFHDLISNKPILVRVLLGGVAKKTISSYEQSPLKQIQLT